MHNFGHSYLIKIHGRSLIMTSLKDILGKRQTCEIIFFFFLLKYSTLSSFLFRLVGVTAFKKCRAFFLLMRIAIFISSTSYLIILFYFILIKKNQYKKVQVTKNQLNFVIYECFYHRIPLRFRVSNI